MVISKELIEEIDFNFSSETVFVQADKLKVERIKGKTTIYYKTKRDFARALLLVKTHDQEKEFVLTEESPFDSRCFLVDCSRNGILNLATVKKLIRILAMLDYTSLMLYTEDTYEVVNEPVFGYLRGRYTIAEMKEIDAYAREYGIEIIPCIQTLAHLQAMRRWYNEYEHIFDIDDILLVDDERTYELIDNMFKTLSECFSTRRVHIGYDEAHNVGRGQYLDKHGYKTPFEILSKHLNKVCDIAKKYGFSVVLWSDMFINTALKNKTEEEQLVSEVPDWVVDLVPQNASVSHWDYSHIASPIHEQKFKMHQKFKCPLWMAFSSKKALGFLPKNSVASDHFELTFELSEKYRMRHVINCAWGDGGTEASLFSILPAIVEFSARAHKQTLAEMRAQFEALTGYKYLDYVKLDWPDTFCNKYKDTVCVTKVMLYNDLFLGQLDKEVEAGAIQIFEKSLLELKKLRHGNYSYVFDAACALTDVMLVKYNLGVRLREAYQKGDKKTLKLLAKEMSKLIKKLTVFLSALERQWMIENKPHGFDIQLFRIGGVIQRVKHCKARLMKYISGELNEISELEETLLDDVWMGKNPLTGRQGYNDYAFISSVNKF